MVETSCASTAVPMTPSTVAHGRSHVRVDADEQRRQVGHDVDRQRRLQLDDRRRRRVVVASRCRWTRRWSRLALRDVVAAGAKAGRDRSMRQQCSPAHCPGCVDLEGRVVRRPLGDVRAPDAPRARQRARTARRTAPCPRPAPAGRRPDRPPPHGARPSVAVATCTPAPVGPSSAGSTRCSVVSGPARAAPPPRPRRAVDRRRWPTAPRRGSRWRRSA